MSMGYIVYREDLADEAEIQATVDNNPDMYPMGTAMQTADGVLWLVVFNDGVTVTLCALSCQGGCPDNRIEPESNDCRFNFDYWFGNPANTLQEFDGTSTKLTATGAGTGEVTYEKVDTAIGAVADVLTVRWWVDKVDSPPTYFPRFLLWVNTVENPLEGELTLQVDLQTGAIGGADAFGFDFTYTTVVHADQIEVIASAPINGETIQYFAMRVYPAATLTIDGAFEQFLEGEITVANWEGYIDGTTQASIQQWGKLYSGQPCPPSSETSLINRLDALEAQVVLLGGTI